MSEWLMTILLGVVEGVTEFPADFLYGASSIGRALV